MTRVLLLLLISAHAVWAGLARYSSLVVADKPEVAGNSSGVRVTYLGTNGYQFETGGHAILIDPYFSRISLSQTLLGARIEPNVARVNDGLQHVRHKVDAIFVTHAHFDHLLDAPLIMQKTSARLFGSSTAVELATRAGADAGRCQAVRPGDIRRTGPWKVTVLPAAHDRVFLMGVPFHGEVKTNEPPVKASDWVIGQSLSFLIEGGGKRIFIDSGGTPDLLPSEKTRPVDLAILGVALPDARNRFGATVRRLRPRFVLPSHQDNFFKPLDHGFQFGQLTDFSEVLHLHQRGNLPGRLILLDYFRPWTVPNK